MLPSVEANKALSLQEDKAFDISKRFYKRFSSKKLGLDLIIKKFGLELDLSNLEELNYDQCLNAVKSLVSINNAELNAENLNDSVIGLSSMLALSRFKGFDFSHLLEDVDFTPVLYLSNILTDSIMIPMGYPSVNLNLRNQFLNSILSDDGVLYNFFNELVLLYSVNKKLSLSLLREVLHEYQSSFAEHGYSNISDYKLGMLSFLPDLKLLFTEAVEFNFYRAYPYRFSGSQPINLNAAMLDFDFPSAKELQDIFENHDLNRFSCNFSLDGMSSYDLDYVSYAELEQKYTSEKVHSFESKIVEIVQDSVILSQLIYAPNTDFDLANDCRNERFELLHDLLSELLDNNRFGFMMKNNKFSFLPAYVKSYHGYINEFLSPFKKQLYTLQHALSPVKSEIVEEEIELNVKQIACDPDLDSANNGVLTELSAETLVEDELNQDDSLRISAILIMKVPEIIAKNPFIIKQNMLIEELKNEIISEFSIEKESEAYLELSKQIAELVLIVRNNG